MKKDGLDYQYIIAIGISTGGPKALNEIVAVLPEHLPATYVVVQHMPPGFTKSLAQRLDSISEIRIKEAEQGERLCRGSMLIAPGGKQFKVIDKNGLQVLLTEEDAYKGHRPSVNIMLESLAKLNMTKKVIGIIMTGMGNDGLEGVQQLSKVRGTTIIAQDEATSVIYGMPKAVINAGLAQYVVPLNRIADTIIKVMGG